MAEDAPRVRVATKEGLPLVGLALVFLVGFAVRAWPLTQFAIWGSDTGEYLRLTRRLVETGRIGFATDGWGLAYPYFPGLHALAGALHAVVGLRVETALLVTGPLVGGLVPCAVALLGDHVASDGRVGLVAGLVAATAFPLVFVTSHAMPATVGHLLLAATVLASYHVTGRLRALPPDLGVRAALREVAPWAPLALLPALALVPTHHLSLYFLVGALAGGALLRELGSRTTHPLVVAWEAALVTLLVLLASWWWLGVAVPFHDRIVADVLPLPAPVIVVLAYLLLAALPLVVQWKRGLAREDHALRRAVGAWTFDVRARGPWSHLAWSLGALTALLVAGFLVAGTRVPGTVIQVTPLALLYVAPLAVAASLAVPAGGLVRLHRHGPAVLGWIGAVAASFLFALLTSNRVLLPYRHVDVVLVPVALLVGVGAVHLHAFLPRGRWRRAAAAALVLLVAANAAAAYPPPDAMGGFQEGITQDEMQVVRWAGDHLGDDALVATDHRLSSVLYGVAGVNATWDAAGPVLHAGSWEEARPHAEAFPSPSGVKPVTHVLVSPVMRDHGVALYQWENARPLSDAALEKLQDPPFETLHEREGVVLYEVDWSATNATAS